MLRIVVSSMVALAGCTLDPIVDDPPDRADRAETAACREVTSYTFVSRSWGAPQHPTVFVCGAAIEVTCGDGERALLVPSAQLACGPNVSTFASRDRRTCRGPIALSAACTNSWGSVVYTATEAN